MSDSSIAIICSSVVSIISVCIPLLTTLISNHHAKHMKDLELSYENKVNAYKDFFSEYGKFISIKNYANLQLLGESVSKALMFANPTVREKLLIILQFCAKTETRDAMRQEYIEKAYIDVVPLIADDLSSSYKTINESKQTTQIIGTQMTHSASNTYHTIFHIWNLLSFQCLSDEYNAIIEAASALHVQTKAVTHIIAIK